MEALMIVLFLFGVMSFFLMIGCATEGEGALVFMALIAWILFHGSLVYWVYLLNTDKTPYKYEAEYICTPHTVKLDEKRSIQEVDYRDKDVLHTINLTDIFKSTLDSNTKVLIKINGKRSVYGFEQTDPQNVEIYRGKP